jgi:hypothetical protein
MDILNNITSGFRGIFTRKPKPDTGREVQTFQELYFGWIPFYRIHSVYGLTELLKLVSERYDSVNEIVDPGFVQIMLQEPYRRSILVVTNLRVYKIMEDKKRNGPILNWSCNLPKFRDSLPLRITTHQWCDNKIYLVVFPHQPKLAYNVDERFCKASQFHDRISGLVKLTVNLKKKEV